MVVKNVTLSDEKRSVVPTRRDSYEWKPGRLPLHLTQKEWSIILHWILRGLPAVVIAQETGIERKRVLRALTYVRMAFQKDIPEVFSGIVEVDETYIGGQYLPDSQAGKKLIMKQLEGLCI